MSSSSDPLLPVIASLLHHEFRECFRAQALTLPIKAISLSRASQRRSHDVSTTDGCMATGHENEVIQRLSHDTFMPSGCFRIPMPSNLIMGFPTLKPLLWCHYKAKAHRQPLRRTLGRTPSTTSQFDVLS
jgi:hypothetical protein